MNKFIFSSILAVWVFVLSPTRVLAQNPTFERAYQDYLYNRTLYDRSFKEYQAARNAYIGNPTLSLKDEAKNKTLSMLRERDQLMVVYFTALRSRITELAGLDAETKSGALTKIDDEVVWYSNHKSSYKDDDQLESLFDKSDEAKVRNEKNTQLVQYEALLDISLGEQQGLRIAQEAIYSDLKNIINERVSLGTLTLSPFDNWFRDIDTTIQSLKSNESEAVSTAKKIYNTYNSGDSYNEALNILSTSLNPLAQLNRFLTEVLTYITNQE